MAGGGELKGRILRRVKAPQVTGKPAPESGLLVSGRPVSTGQPRRRKGNDPHLGKGSGRFQSPTALFNLRKSELSAEASPHSPPGFACSLQEKQAAASGSQFLGSRQKAVALNLGLF